jgi:hypothetical protein
MVVSTVEELLIEFATTPDVRAKLVENLAASRVAVALNKGLENGELAADFKPLTLNAEQGFPVVATFTAPDKITPWVQREPDFQHALVTEFSWVLSITRPPFGIAVNPGYKYSFVLAPAEVEALTQELRAAT